MACCATQSRARAGRVGTRRGGEAQHFALFSFSHRIFCSCFSSGGLLVDLWPRFTDVAHPTCTFGLLSPGSFRASSSGLQAKSRIGPKRSERPNSAKSATLLGPLSLDRPSPGQPFTQTAVSCRNASEPPISFWPFLSTPVKECASNPRYSLETMRAKGHLQDRNTLFHVAFFFFVHRNLEL